MSTNRPPQNPEQLLANVLPDGVLMLTDQGHILWYNDAADALFHIKKSKKKQVEALIDHPGFDFLTHTQSETPIAIEWSSTPPKQLAISLHPYPQQQFLLLVRDITHVYHLEKMRQDFLANVSHELRTPLTVVHGYLETLMDQCSENQHPWKKIFVQMYQQSLRMERLVNDLLLLSRLEADISEAPPHQPVAIGALLQNIYHEAEALSGEHKHRIELHIDETLRIYGLEEELRSAFSNIIFNAVKYTPDNGEIAIHWSQNQGAPCFKVTDTGIGIAKEHIPRLTERFYRIDRARSRSSGGTGLGLAIVKHVLLRHKARLRIESKPGKGSTFCCIFPEQSIVAN